MISAVFEPLGYTVQMESYTNDDRFSQWGMSRYVTLTLSGTVLLRELLHPLYVLIPVFDTKKQKTDTGRKPVSVFYPGREQLIPVLTA